MQEQLEEIRGMLIHDGYDLEWRSTGENTVELTIVAGPDACADCLVPKMIMEKIVNKTLGKAGVTVSELVYPADVAGASH